MALRYVFIKCTSSYMILYVTIITMIVANQKIDHDNVLLYDNHYVYDSSTIVVIHYLIIRLEANYLC